MFKNKLDDIMNQELTRHEFLKTCGAVALAIIGLPALMRAVRSSSSIRPSGPSNHNGRPYGK